MRPIGALCFIAIAAATWICLIAPASAPASVLSAALPLSEPHEALARRDNRERAYPQAAAEIRAALANAPIRGNDWLQLAKLDVLQHGDLTAAGDQALSHAYDAVPYDLSPGSQRMAFAVRHYKALSPAMKANVLDEISAWSSSPALKARLAPLLGLSSDPDLRAKLLAAIRAPSP